MSAIRGEVPLSLSLRHGGNVHMGVPYELVGQDAAPVLIVAGGISAGRHVVSSSEFPEPGWWQAQAATLGSSGFRLLSIDWIGSDGAFDLAIDPLDQATAIEGVLDALSIAEAAAFIGASYGAMVGMHLAARAPDRIGALLAISASAGAHPYSSAWRSLQRQAIRLGEKALVPEAGVALARAIAMLTYRTAAEFEERFPEAPAVENGKVRVGADSYLQAQGERHRARMSATTYRRLSESIDLHLIDPATIQLPVTLAAVDNDFLIPSADIERLALQISGARLRRITSRFGHDAFLKEEGQIAGIIGRFLSSLEQQQ